MKDEIADFQNPLACRRLTRHDNCACGALSLEHPRNAVIKRHDNQNGFQ
jgi:hypothetical protein